MHPCSVWTTPYDCHWACGGAPLACCVFLKFSLLDFLECRKLCVAPPTRVHAPCPYCGDPSNEVSPLVPFCMEWTLLLPPVSWVAVPCRAGWGHLSIGQDVEVALLRVAVWLPLHNVGSLRRCTKTLSQQLLPVDWRGIIWSACLSRLIPPFFIFGCPQHS